MFFFPGGTDYIPIEVILKMLHLRLQELEKNGQPITVGIIGAGTFGTQMVLQISRMAGMRISAIADLDTSRATGALHKAGMTNDKISHSETSEDINQAIEGDRTVVTASADALIEADLDVVVEATGLVEVGAKHAYNAIGARKNVTMVTVEADVLVGHLLKKRADEMGVIYSLAYGDEPAMAYELYDWAQTLGFRVIAAGKGTRFKKEFRKANPDDVPRLYGFSGEDYNAQMFGSFLDGSKHAIEMAALSNATGLVPDIRGMHFPTLDLREIPNKLCHVSKGGMLGNEGVVEAISSMHSDGSYVERDIRGGLYAVVAAEEGGVIDSLASYGEIIGVIMGERSRHAMIYRPHHFVGHEAPIGIARMMLRGESVGAPIGHISDVVAAAKKKLKPGDILDGEGGYCAYGLLEKAEVAKSENLLPLGLTQGAEVVREIPEDGMITYEDVELPESFALKLRKEQEADESSELSDSR